MSLCLTTKLISSDRIPAFAVSDIKLPLQHSLSIVTEIDHVYEDADGDMPFYKYKITLKKKDNVLEETYYQWNNPPPYNYLNFVPLGKGKYTTDLNNDGHLEFAILPWTYSNAAYRTVKFFTIKDNKITPYRKEGKYNIERGPNVLLGCPKCWKFSLKECQKCH